MYRICIFKWLDAFTEKRHLQFQPVVIINWIVAGYRTFLTQSLAVYTALNFDSTNITIYFAFRYNTIKTHLSRNIGL